MNCIISTSIITSTDLIRVYHIKFLLSFITKIYIIIAISLYCICIELNQILDKHFKYYNNERLHSGIDYLRTADLFYGRAEKIKQKRAEGLAKATELRKE